jgi:outer membrane protein TolC
VTASFAPQYITPSGLFQPSRSWRFLVSFSQPLYQGGLQRAAHHIRQVAVDRATFGLTAVQLRARSEVRVADEAVRILSRAAANARQASETADEVLRITTTAFELGATTNIEVIDAQRSARDTATVAALADDAIRRARLDLLVALGRFPR